MMSLVELAFGRVAPSLLAPNEQVKQRGLEAINAYRTKYGHRPLAELPKAYPGTGYDFCLLGRCVSDMPDQTTHAYVMSLESRDVRRLEIRFEREQLPELSVDLHSPYDPLPLRYLDAHAHPLAR
jgi:hypothetical protein